MSTSKVDTVQSTGGGAVTLTNQAAAKVHLLGSNAGSPFNALNVSSGVDNGTGDYTYNITNALSSSSTMFLATAGDIVADPSAPKAFVEGIREGKEWIWDNGILKESEVAKIHRVASANKQAEAFEMFLSKL